MFAIYSASRQCIQLRLSQVIFIVSFMVMLPMTLPLRLKYLQDLQSFVKQRGKTFVVNICKKAHLTSNLKFLCVYSNTAPHYLVYTIHPLIFLQVKFTQVCMRNFVFRGCCCPFLSAWVFVFIKLTFTLLICVTCIRQAQKAFKK